MQAVLNVPSCRYARFYPRGRFGVHNPPASNPAIIYAGNSTEHLYAPAWRPKTSLLGGRTPAGRTQELPHRCSELPQTNPVCQPGMVRNIIAAPNGQASVATMTQSFDVWRTPPALLSLVDRDVHVWKAPLDLATTRVQRLGETLAEDEQARARRLFFERDRRRFIVCRGVLRALLGRYLGAAPGALKFRYSPHGKPAVAIGFGGDALRFSVAHAHDMALYGVAIGREIGIDLEHIRPDFASDHIAEQYFSRREVAALRALSPASRLEAFFNCWTRKEAYIKARGEGLSLPLDRFDVSLAPGEPAALLSTLDDPPEASRWSLQELFPGPGFVAAIAVEGHDWRLQCWQWSGA
jgi:4'-phosphopantetheinyl transferase